MPQSVGRKLTTSRERSVRIREVEGSNPFGSTKDRFVRASLSFLCRDIYQRLFICSLILALCCHCAELLKGDIKFNFQCVISIDINRFDELGNNHLLCSKVTVVIEVSPGLYPGDSHTQ